MQKNIFITEGLGLIRSCLAKKYINSGENVTILSRSEKKKDNVKGLEDKITLKIKDIKDISPEDVAS